jgi:hypothetical protein
MRSEAKRKSEFGAIIPQYVTTHVTGRKTFHPVFEGIC